MKNAVKATVEAANEVLHTHGEPTSCGGQFEMYRHTSRRTTTSLKWQRIYSSHNVLAVAPPLGRSVSQSISWCGKSFQCFCVSD